MTPAQRRALEDLHDEIDSHFVTEPNPKLVELYGRWIELVHRAGAGQPTAVQDMRRLAEIGHKALEAGQPCPLRCAGALAYSTTHEDDCPIVGAMGRYPRTDEVTPEEIAHLRALCEAATEPPWVRQEAQDGEVLPDGSGYAGDWYETNTVEQAAGPENDARCVADCMRPEDAAFIAAARVALPRLLDDRDTAQDWRCASGERLARIDLLRAGLGLGPDPDTCPRLEAHLREDEKRVIAGIADVTRQRDDLDADLEALASASVRVIDNFKECARAALDALPEDIRIAADGDLVRGIEGLEAAYQVERKAVMDHAAEIARLRAALSSRSAEAVPWEPPDEWHYTPTAGGDALGARWVQSLDTELAVLPTGDLIRRWAQ